VQGVVEEFALGDDGICRERNKLSQHPVIRSVDHCAFDYIFKFGEELSGFGLLLAL
jgi:hypothetical protein